MKANFRTEWEAKPVYREAFEAIRGMLVRGARLVHVDYDAAENPEISGRPLEVFIDASDYGFCATLTQRLTPHGAPKIIAMVAKAFADVQLRWSAMERELYALWFGVTSHERVIKGFLTFCYIDHKNNLFSAAMLDNRRISKKVSNWAMELQQFNLVKVWIRGEANILSDAPSRAPWENALAMHLPIPNRPVLDLIQAMYRDPNGLEKECEACAVEQRLQDWEPLDLGERPGAHGDDGDRERPTGRTGYSTPSFGQRICRLEETWAGELGQGEVLEGFGDEYPMWPRLVSTEEGPLRVAVVTVQPKPVPQHPEDHPYSLSMGHDSKHEKGVGYRVRWNRPIEFDDGSVSEEKWFLERVYGSKEGAAKAAWEYFDARFRVYLNQTKAGLGLCGRPAADGLCYHGLRESHEFKVHPGQKEMRVRLSVTLWNPNAETLVPATEYCTNCELVGTPAPGVQTYRCNGHTAEDAEGDVVVGRPGGASYRRALTKTTVKLPSGAHEYRRSGRIWEPKAPVASG